MTLDLGEYPTLDPSAFRDARTGLQQSICS